MDIVKLDICNIDLGAPSDMQDGSCAALPVYEHSDEHGQWSMSFWKPDVQELAVLAAGGVIKLDIRAHRRQHPVIGVGALAVTWSQPPVLDRKTAAVFTFDDIGFCWSYNNNLSGKDRIVAQPPGFASKGEWYVWAAVVARAVRDMRPDLAPRTPHRWIAEVQHPGWSYKEEGPWVETLFDSDPETQENRALLRNVRAVYL